MIGMVLVWNGCVHIGISAGPGKECAVGRRTRVDNMFGGYRFVIVAKLVLPRW